MKHATTLVNPCLENRTEQENFKIFVCIFQRKEWRKYAETPFPASGNFKGPLCLRQASVPRRRKIVLDKIRIFVSKDVFCLSAVLFWKSIVLSLNPSLDLIFHNCEILLSTDRAIFVSTSRMQYQIWHIWNCILLLNLKRHTN